MSCGYKSLEACGSDDRRSLVKMRAVRSATIKRDLRLYSATVSRYLKRCSASAGRPASLSGPGGFLPVLLIGALLLCHGVLGYAHEMSRGCDGPHPMQTATAAGEHAAGHTGGHGTEDPACGHTLTAYFAVVLALFGAAFLGFLLGAQERQRAVVSPARRSFPLSGIAYLPRGPTLPFLQVYRL